MLPVTPCAVAGVNCTVKDAFWPALIVAGSASPLIAKPLPEICAAVITRSTLPLLVILAVCVAFCPTFTFPKLSDAGDKDSPDAIPTPVRSTSSGEFAASLAMLSLPLRVPRVCGDICKVTVLLAPAAIEVMLAPLTSE